MKRFLISLIALVTIINVAGCDRQQDKSPPKSAPPAKVENAVKETDLTSVKLSPEAEERLGVQTTAVESRQMRRTRTLGGEIVVPPGRQIVISAPLSGTLMNPEDGHTPLPGTPLSSGQTVLRLSPAFLSDREVLQTSDRINLTHALADLATAIAEAEGQVATAQVQLEAAKVKKNRADLLRKENVGSERAYEEAEAEFLIAEAQDKTAQRRLETLKNIHLEAESGHVALLPIESPQDGLLQAMYAASGQAVSAGAPLFEVTSIDPVWVQVSVYAGDLADIDPQALAGVAGLTSNVETPMRSAKPVTAPPSADAQAATVNLFYQLDNADAKLLPGQRMSVTLTLKTAEESLVIPWSAVLYDVNGGTWVYENTEPQVFVRRRVEVRHVIDGMAILARGPAVGTKIVTMAAAELFGTEFGGGK